METVPSVPLTSRWRWLWDHQDPLLISTQPKDPPNQLDRQNTTSLRGMDLGGGDNFVLEQLSMFPMSCTTYWPPRATLYASSIIIWVNFFNT